jgi:hypothetical protein
MTTKPEREPRTGGPGFALVAIAVVVLLLLGVGGLVLWMALGRPDMFDPAALAE